MEANTTCRLCLSTESVLTREHIPPKSTGNTGLHRIRSVSFNSQGPTELDLPDGFALSVLCEKCNSRYGSRLGTTFADFVRQVQQSGRFISPRGGVYALAMDAYPARVFRQLLLNYLCIHPVSTGGNWQAIREFIRSRDCTVPAEIPRIGLYCNIANTYRVVPVGSLGSLGRLKEPWLGAESAAPGLGVVYSIRDEDVHPVIRPKLTDISAWAGENFSTKKQVVLELPRYRVETPYPLGFGRPSEVDKWQERHHIMWLATQFDTDVGSNMGAVLWKSSPDAKARRRTRP